VRKKTKPNPRKINGTNTKIKTSPKRVALRWNSSSLFLVVVCVVVVVVVVVVVDSYITRQGIAPPVHIDCTY